MKKKFFLVILSFFLLINSCTMPIETFSDYDRSANIKKNQSYAWIELNDSTLNNQQIEKMFADQIMNFSNVELKKKGMILNTENPDVLFNFNITTQDQTVYSQAPTVSVGVGFGGPGYYVGGSVPVAGGEITASTKREAFLHIQMYETKSGNLLWTGGAKKEVTGFGNPLDNLKLAIRYIFMRLPIKHKVKKS